MGAVRMRVQTADKNITIIHTTPVLQLSCEELSVCTKQIHQDVLTSNSCFQLKYKSSFHNVAVIEVSCLNRESKMHRSSTIYTQKQICGWILTWQTSGDRLYHWRKCYYGLWTGILARSNGLKLKCPNDRFVLTNTQLLLHKMLTDGLEWCGLLVDYCDVFISCLDSHSDGTHSGSIVKQVMNAEFLQICSHDETAYGWVNFSKCSFLGELFL